MVTLLSEKKGTTTGLTFLWLEITGKCNLSCNHCYAGSSPQGSHGLMTIKNWQRAIEEAAALGCQSIQFIGGEPTVHPGLAQLIQIAHSLDMQIEVYTNLVSIKSSLWETFQACHVRIATSFYTINPQIHAEITRGPHSLQKTTANIRQALARGLPVRAGLVEMRADQAIEEAEFFLRELGVQNIKRDHVRSVGRGETYIQVEDPRQALCGQCSRGKACITPSGEVYPCVFSRWLPQGNVLNQSLQEIITGKMKETRTDLTSFFLQRSTRRSTASQGDSFPCMPATEKYLKTQDLSELFAKGSGNCAPDDVKICEPDASSACDPDNLSVCDPDTAQFCDPDDEECNPDIPACRPNYTCIPDYEEPCDPIKPCEPMASPCTPNMPCNPDEE